MKALLDTHAWLWFGLVDPRLSDGARAIIEDPDNEILLSPTSFWEIAIKISLGKYSLDEELDDFVARQLEENAIKVLPIDAAHARVVATLPFHHRDPFDRMLVAQAIVERVPLISSDAELDQYSIQRVW